MAENSSRGELNQARVTARPFPVARKADDQPIVLPDAGLRRIPVLTNRQLCHELDQAKEHLRRSSRTFVNVGRLRAFMAPRLGEKGTDLDPDAAPLTAMKYILWLEKRLSKLGEQVSSGGIPADLE